MTTINVQYIPTNYGIEFVSYWPGLRMWLVDLDATWYKTVGKYCPHKNIGRDECFDCALVLDGGDE